jgi:hypothetical protein
MNANANEQAGRPDGAILATATLRLVEAETACARARRRLHAEQRAAVLGLGDPLALDEAVLAYRSAKVAYEAARAAWRRAYGPRAPLPAPADGGAGGAGADPAPRAEEAPEARFARWLLEASGQGDPALAA